MRKPDELPTSSILRSKAGIGPTCPLTPIPRVGPQARYRAGDETAAPARTVLTMDRPSKAEPQPDAGDPNTLRAPVRASRLALLSVWGAVVCGPVCWLVTLALVGGNARGQPEWLIAVPGIGALGSLVAAVLGVVAVFAIKHSRGRRGGMGEAWTGVVLGGWFFVGIAQSTPSLICQRACNNPHLGASKIPHPSSSEPGGATMAELSSRCSTLPAPTHRREEPMIREALWQEIHRLHTAERWSKTLIAQTLDLDRKTVRTCLAQPAWTRYRRPAPVETVLTAHRAFLEARAPAVDYSAQVLFQELTVQHGYTGSYDTVKRFVRPLRAAQDLAARATVRFETPPGLQSQIDWGQATIAFRSGRAIRHFFILTLGYSRRSFYLACRDEQLPTFLEAHERAFDHFGGHTKEHLYDRPRTVCRPTGDGGIVWNPTFKAFATYWGFDPRLCRPYRAQTKGKCESGVKYLKRNFLIGREFLDDVHLGEDLLEWTTTPADQRIHGTTHERPIDRFAVERAHLLATTHQPAFRLEAT
jgi:transposase